MHLEALGGYLHDTGVTACIHHLAEGLLDHIGLWSRITAWCHLSMDQGSDGTNQSHIITSILQDCLNHEGGCGLTLRSSDTDDPEFLSRIVKIRCRDLCQCHTGICNTVYIDILCIP